MHQGNEQQGQELSGRYGVDSWPRIADPERALYRDFGLGPGSMSAVLGAKALLRTPAALLSGPPKLAVPVGDVWQMPGVFVLRDGAIVARFRHDSIADRPDYLALLDSAPASGQPE